MDTQTIFNVLVVPALFGLGGLILWLVKFYIPAIEKRKDAELASKLEQQDQELKARIDERKDEREYRQQAGNVAIEVLERVMREAISERSQELDEFRKEIRQYNKSVDRLATKVGYFSQSVRELAAIVGDLKDKIGSLVNTQKH